MSNRTPEQIDQELDKLAIEEVNNSVPSTLSEISEMLNKDAIYLMKNLLHERYHKIQIEYVPFESPQFQVKAGCPVMIYIGGVDPFLMSKETGTLIPNVELWQMLARAISQVPNCIRRHELTKYNRANAFDNFMRNEGIDLIPSNIGLIPILHDDRVEIETMVIIRIKDLETGIVVEQRGDYDETNIENMKKNIHTNLSLRVWEKTQARLIVEFNEAQEEIDRQAASGEVIDLSRIIPD